MNVGVIGLGMMGSAIATRLVMKAVKLQFLIEIGRKQRSLMQTEQKSLTIADQPNEVGDTSDMVIICVKDYQAVANVSFATWGLIESSNRDLIITQVQHYLSRRIE